MFNKIAAIVVFYHPTNEVINNILTYSKDINHVIVIDNSEKGTDKNEEYVSELTKKNPDRSFHYHSMGGNKGLAEAFNFGLAMADQLGCDWCFTMDSDSSFQNDIVLEYQNAEKSYANSKVIAYAPQHDYDRIIVKKSNKIETTTWTMTSGTMFHIKKTIEAGGFDPWFFVDGLDVELGYRLKKLGYIIIRCYGAVLNHLPAQTVTIEVLGKKIRYGVAEPIRYYYQARADMRIIISYFAPYAFFDMLMRLIKIIFLFDRKRQYLRAWGRGVLDAVNNRGGGADTTFKA